MDNKSKLVKNNVFERLKKYTKHDNIFFVPRGNKAIFSALKIVHGSGFNKILIPDQGGWLTYSHYAKKLKFDVKMLETDYGIINLDNLKENNAAIIYSNPAAYYAEQPFKEIYEICKKNNIIVILDISGCIGSDFYHGNYADVIVCSFGRWKPINLGYGGFISIQDKEILKLNNNFLKNLEFKEKYAALYNKLIDLKTRYDFFEKINKKIKSELKNLNILHKYKNGINVIIKFDNDKEKNKIIDYCEKNKYEFVVCPKSIKVNENAISIEVKRLE